MAEPLVRGALMKRIPPHKSEALMHAASSQWRAIVPWLFGLAALAGVILVASQYASLAKALRIARAAGWRWLAVGCIVQTGTYVCAAAVWWCVLRAAGVPKKMRRLMRLGVAKVFTDQLLPSGGVSGNLLVIAGLLRRGVPASVAMAAVLIGMMSFYAAYLGGAVAAALLLWLNGDRSSALLGLMAAFIVLAVVLPSIVLWARKLVARHLPGWASRMPSVVMLSRAMAEAPPILLRDPVVLMQATALQLGVFLLDSATLWLVLHGIGQTSPFWVAFVALIVASIMATVGPMPLGLGTFEGGSVAMLHMLGVPMEAALAATLLQRALTFWLPMLPGLWLAHRELKHGSQPATSAAS